MSEAPIQGGHPVGEAARLFREAAQQVLAAADWLDSLDRSTAPDVMLALADSRVKEVNEKLGGWMSRAWTAEERNRKLEEALRECLPYVEAIDEDESVFLHNRMLALLATPAAPLAAEGKEEE